MTSNRSPGRRRRGYMLLEVAMAVALLLAAMTLAMRLDSWVGREQRTAGRRLWATQTLGNLSERVSALTEKELTADRVKALGADLGVVSVLPGAELSAEVEATKPPAPAGKRVALTLRWKNRSGGWEAPARLTSWVYRKGDRR